MLKPDRSEAVSLGGATLPTRPVHPGSSAHTTAAPPDLPRSCVMERQEERVMQSGGQRDALGRFVLQHLLQEVQEVAVLWPLGQQGPLQEHRGGDQKLVLSRPEVRESALTSSGLHLAFTPCPSLEPSFQSTRPRRKYFCFLWGALVVYQRFTAVRVPTGAFTCSSQPSCQGSAPEPSPSSPGAPCCRESMKETAMRTGFTAVAEGEAGATWYSVKPL